MNDLNALRFAQYNVDYSRWCYLNNDCIEVKKGVYTLYLEVTDGEIKGFTLLSHDNTGDVEPGVVREFESDTVRFGRCYGVNDGDSYLVKDLEIIASDVTIDISMIFKEKKKITSLIRKVKGSNVLNSVCVWFD